jgi:hypothetical protein
LVPDGDTVPPDDGLAPVVSVNMVPGGMVEPGVAVGVGIGVGVGVGVGNPGGNGVSDAVGTGIAAAVRNCCDSLSSTSDIFSSPVRLAIAANNDSELLLFSNPTMVCSNSAGANI